MSDLLTALRLETHDMHHALHDHPTLQACQQKRLDQQEYIHMLQAFYQPWKTLIPSVAQVPVEELKPKLTKRFQLLLDDLLELEVDVHGLMNENEPLTDLGELLGTCYVVIGSSMGGTTLSQCIKTALPGAPLSYLSMSAKEAGWPTLSKYLSGLRAQDYPGASQAATNAFQQIQAELSALV